MTYIRSDARGVNNIVEVEKWNEWIHLHQHRQRLPYASCGTQYGHLESGDPTFCTAIATLQTNIILSLFKSPMMLLLTIEPTVGATATEKQNKTNLGAEVAGDSRNSVAGTWICLHGPFSRERLLRLQMRVRMIDYKKVALRVEKDVMWYGCANWEACNCKLTLSQAISSNALCCC